MSNPESPTLIIYNARIGGREVGSPILDRGYVAVTGDTITEVGAGDLPHGMLTSAAEAIDACGALLMPGVIDGHVHFRDPGLTHKGDMATESHAAAAGGVTSFLEMPNTSPATVTIEAWEDKMQRASQVCTANYAFWLGATNSNLDVLRSADYSRVPGVKLFLGSSTGNMLVDRDETIRTIFTEIPALISVHAEDEATIAANRKALIARYGEELPIECHPVIRNHDACYEASARAVALARETGARLHLLHISTSDELKLLQGGPTAAKRITAETCPQYLVFCDIIYNRFGSRIKCNPAIKRPTDRDDLRFAVSHNVIDTIATDHAPHLLAEKQGTALTAASGMPSVQFALPVMMELVREEVFDTVTVIDHLCCQPAQVFGIPDRGFIRPGFKADIVLFNDDTEPWTISDNDVIGPCGWTPYAGLTLSGRVELTLLNGQPVFRHGVLFGDRIGQPLTFVQQSR